MRLRTIPFALPCMALIIFLSPLAGAATVLPPGYEAVMRTVNFADLDLTNTRGVATLYQRIKTAAGKVCESNDSRPYGTLLRQVRRCEKEAITQAVEDVNSSELTTFHLSATGQPDFP
jgi:UrcA family protein